MIKPLSPTHELAPFLGEPLPVELVAALADLRVEGSSVVLTCDTLRFAPELQDYYGTLVETVLAQPTPGEPATIRIDFWSPSVARVRYATCGGIQDRPSVMLVGSPESAVAVEVVEHGDRWTLVTQGLRIDVLREPWQLVARDAAGRLLWQTRPVDIAGLRRQHEPWNPPEQQWVFLHRYAYPLGRTVGDRAVAFASFGLRHDERIYGFGESFGPLDKVGSRQQLWLQEAFSNASPASYKQVPFHFSSRGYGVFVHTSNAVSYHVGDLDHTALSVTVEDSQTLDLFLLAGATPRELLPRYTALTGQPSLPPRWSFGLWMGRMSYQSQEEVLRVARELREHRIPCDVMHIDTGWFARDYVCDLTFSPERFPDPAGMCAELAELGFRVCLWQWPNYNVGSPLYEEGRTSGYLAKRTSGHTYTFAGGYGEDAGLIDFSNEAAVQWYQRNLGALFALGVAAIKADYGEGAPPTARYAGVESAEMHNLYPLLYQRAAWDASVAARGRDDTVLWARSGWAGSQRYPVHWSGDGVSRFEDLACVLRAALSIGLSGFPFYSHDIGGFSGLPDAELYIRWAQLGLFSSHARAHGSPPREPWEYGAAAEEIVRRHLELRYRLMPYIWTEARRCVETSLPMVRPLFVEFPDDPFCWTVDDAYLFGDRLLVAPVLEEGATRRRVYLPPGGWFDFVTKQRHEGGHHIEVAAPLDTVPLFVREDTILPLGPVLQHVDERPLDPLTLELYGVTAAASYDIAHAGGVVTVQVQVGAAGPDVAVAGAPGQVEVSVYPPQSTGQIRGSA